MKVSNLFVLLLISSYFILGGIGMLVYTLKIDKERKKVLWTKYFVYALIIFILLSALMFWPFIMLLIAPMLAAAGYWEVERIAKPKLPIILAYLVIAGSFLGYMKFAMIDSSIAIYLYVLILTFDGFSQVVGQLVGGPKLVPKISPNKTISGFVGGLFVALVTAFVLMGFNSEIFLTAMIIIHAGFFGDVLASYLKRKSGIKDFSDWIPGHGGILDRFDSFIMAGAVMFWFISVKQLL